MQLGRQKTGKPSRQSSIKDVQFNLGQDENTQEKKNFVLGLIDEAL
jgi:hypothetical protein